MDNELRQLAEANTKEIEELKKKYQGTGVLLQEISYEIFELIEDLDIGSKMFDKLIRLERMVDILSKQLKEQNPDMIERRSVEYLLKNAENDICSVNSLFSKGNDALMYSKNDVKRMLRDLLCKSEQMI